MPDWEPPPPSSYLRILAACLERKPVRMNVEAEHLRVIADDIEGMERRLAELTPKERADAE